jgi:uncharacterized OB-fold protein
MTQMLAEGLFRVDGDRAVLLGSRRRAGGAVKFPAERAELFDDPDTIEPVELSTEGTLFTFTTQEFAPPLPYKGKRAPDEFRPYVVGYVELPEGLLVETLIVGADASDLRIGQQMVSTTTIFETADGESFLTYAFSPTQQHLTP